MSNVNYVEEKALIARNIWDKVAARVDALKPGEKITVGDLTNTLAIEYNMKTPDMYHMVKYVLNGYPGTESRKGPKGGTFKL